MPPAPVFFQNPDVYNRRGGTVNYSIGDQLIHGDFPGGLKDLATYRCDVKQQMVDAYATWVETADFDGFRIDTVKHVEPEFWRYFSQKVRQRLSADGKRTSSCSARRSTANDALVGSFTQNGATPGMPVAPQDFLGVPSLQGRAACVLPATTSRSPATCWTAPSTFPQYYTVVAGVLHNGGPTQPIEDLWSMRQSNWGDIPARGGVGVPPASSPSTSSTTTTSAASSSTRTSPPTSPTSARASSRSQFDSIRQLKLENAYVFMFTEQGVPCVYYGDEQGFQGGNDPTNREDPVAHRLCHTPATDSSRIARRLPPKLRPDVKARLHPRRPEGGLGDVAHGLRGGRGHLRLRARRRRRR